MIERMTLHLDTETIGSLARSQFESGILLETEPGTRIAREHLVQEPDLAHQMLGVEAELRDLQARSILIDMFLVLAVVIVGRALQYEVLLESVIGAEIVTEARIERVDDHGMMTKLGERVVPAAEDGIGVETGIGKQGVEVAVRDVRETETQGETGVEVVTEIGTGTGTGIGIEIGTDVAIEAGVVIAIEIGIEIGIGREAEVGEVGEILGGNSWDLH